MPTIAYLGPEHTNTHLAALKKFGRRATYVHAPTVEDVFRLVEREDAEYGVVPIENSLEGAVAHTLDWFIDCQQTPVRIVGEIEFPIHHYLITQRGLSVRDVRKVCSHPQALAQCRPWLQAHLHHPVLLIEMNSTSDAVASIRSAEKTRAAIGRKEAAEQYGFQATPIVDTRENKTRFLLLSLQPTKKGRHNKTSILMALKDKPGALYDVLTPFKREGINLTKIESRPSKKKAWEYYFFIDLEGHASDAKVARALKALQRSTSFFRVLGSYPVTR